jgi:hypothetical protein
VRTRNRSCAEIPGSRSTARPGLPSSRRAGRSSAGCSARTRCRSWSSRHPPARGGGGTRQRGARSLPTPADACRCCPCRWRLLLEAEEAMSATGTWIRTSRRRRTRKGAWCPRGGHGRLLRASSHSQRRTRGCPATARTRVKFRGARIAGATTVAEPATTSSAPPSNRPTRPTLARTIAAGSSYGLVRGRDMFPLASASGRSTRGSSAPGAGPPHPATSRTSSTHAVAHRRLSAVAPAIATRPSSAALPPVAGS